MSIFTDASLLVTLNAKKAGKLYTSIPTDGAGDLDVVRATTATYVGSDGLIKIAGINEPRFDYSNGSCPSILVEPQRTNLVFPSATATTQTRTVTATTYTLSFYGTGSVVLSGVATGTLVGIGSNNRVTLTFTTTAGSLILTVVGSVTNWQLEAGANATSYIPTTTTTVTRNADVISKSGISNLINSEEGCFFVEANSFVNGGNFRQFTLSDGTNNSRLYIGWSSIVDTLLIRMDVAGVNVVNNNITSFNQTSNNKILIKWGGGNLKTFVNGVERLSLTSLTMPTANLFTKLGFDRGVSAGFFEGNVKSVLVFPTQLTDQECIALTTL